MTKPPAKFELYGPCPSGGEHIIVPREGQKNPFAGVAWRVCWRCKAIFMWVVVPPDTGRKNEAVEKVKGAQGSS